jgi:hypothetical protein
MEIVGVKEQATCMERGDAQIDEKIDEHLIRTLFEVAEALNDPEYRDLRRAWRQPVDIPVQIYGHGPDGKPFYANGRATNVSDTGALLLVGVTLSCGDEILISRNKGSKEQKATVTRFGSRRDGLEEVGVAFGTRDEKFWKTRSGRRSDDRKPVGPPSARSRKAWKRQGAR